MTAFLRPAAGLAALALACGPAAATGQLDPAFGGGDGRVLVPLGVGDGADGAFQDVILDHAGRIVAAGVREDETPGGSEDFVVARLLADGSLDGAFGVGGTTAVAFDLAADKADSAIGLFETPDGRYVACGTAQNTAGIGGAGALAVVRLLATGARDTSFDLDGRRTVQIVHPDDGVATPAVVADCTAAPGGGIVLVGALYSAALDAASALVVRLDASGGLDTTFDGDGVLVFDPLPEHAPVASLSGVVVQPDGTILAAGFVHGGGLGLQYDMLAVRLLAGGSLDASFGEGGVRVVAFDQGGDNWDIAAHLALAGDGGMYMVGSVSTATSGKDMALVKLSTEGDLDPAFGTGGRALLGFDAGGSLHDDALQLVLDSAGRVYAAGRVQRGTSDYDAAVVRVTPAGALDTSFASGGWHVSGDSTEFDSAAAIAMDRRERVVAAGEAYGTFASGQEGLVLRLTGERIFGDGFEPPL